MLDFPGGSVRKNPPVNAGSSWVGKIPLGGNSNPPSILAWKSHEQRSVLLPMGLQGVRHK